MRFSIIIPCFNRHEDLRCALRSCFEQTFSDFEIIVVDDGSSPPLDSVCAEFSDPRIRHLRNPSNLGVSRCRNVGIDAASGQYVSFLDSDDVYLPDRLRVLDELIRVEKAPPSILFHCQHRRLDPAGTGIVMPSRPPTLHERLDEYILAAGNHIQTNSFLVERSLAQKIKFDPDCDIYEDTRFVLECWLATNDYVFCDDILSVYNDFRLNSRLSRQHGFERLRPMLHFAQTKCSRRAHLGFAAHASAEIALWQSPLEILTNVLRAYRSGVSGARCGIYLARSAFGTATLERLIRAARLAAFRLGGKTEQRPKQSSVRG